MEELIKKEILSLWEKYVEYEQTSPRWTNEEDLTFAGFIKWFNGGMPNRHITRYGVYHTGCYKIIIK